MELQIGAGRVLRPYSQAGSEFVSQSVKLAVLKCLVHAQDHGTARAPHAGSCLPPRPAGRPGSASGSVPWLPVPPGRGWSGDARFCSALCASAPHARGSRPPFLDFQPPFTLFPPPAVPCSPARHTETCFPTPPPAPGSLRTGLSLAAGTVRFCALAGELDVWPWPWLSPGRRSCFIMAVDRHWDSRDDSRLQSCLFQKPVYASGASRLCLRRS